LLKFNELDKINKCERRSHHGEFKVILDNTLKAQVPINPVGRTGIIGRGHLGRWGLISFSFLFIFNI
jgi:hypothetical protein